MTLDEYLRRERDIVNTIRWSTICVVVFVSTIAWRLLPATTGATALSIVAMLAVGGITDVALRMRSLRCPRCRESLGALGRRVVYEKKIRIDACPHCGLRPVESYTTGMS